MTYAGCCTKCGFSLTEHREGGDAEFCGTTILTGGAETASRGDVLAALAALWAPEDIWDTCIVCGAPATHAGLYLTNSPVGLPSPLTRVGWCGNPRCEEDRANTHYLGRMDDPAHWSQTTADDHPACYCGEHRDCDVAGCPCYCHSQVVVS